MDKKRRVNERTKLHEKRESNKKERNGRKKNRGKIDAISERMNKQKKRTNNALTQTHTNTQAQRNRPVMMETI